jgi:hypothetical protein
LKIRRKTEVKIQTERFLGIRKSRAAFFAACAECDATLHSPEEAALVLGKRTRDIYREIENGTRHFTELANGELLVCCDAPTERQQKKSEL